jgi:ribonuclease HI
MYVLQMHFSASNNAAEYKVLLHGLRIAMALGICRLKVLGDSMLVVNQVNKEWSCLDDKILLYSQELRKLENNFDGLEYLHVLQEKMRSRMSCQAQFQLGFGSHRGLFAGAPWAKYCESFSQD